MRTLFFIMTMLTIHSCTSYTTLLSSHEYKGDKIKVQRHYDPCCGWTGLRFVYNEAGNTEDIIYFYWFDVPYAEKEVRTLKGKKVIHTEKYALVFDTTNYREPLFVPQAYNDTTSADLNDKLLTTKTTRPTVPLNRIDSVLLFHSSLSLPGVDYKERPMWLLQKAAGYIQSKQNASSGRNGTKAIK